MGQEMMTSTALDGAGLGSCVAGNGIHSASYACGAKTWGRQMPRSARRPQSCRLDGHGDR